MGGIRMYGLIFLAGGFSGLLVGLYAETDSIVTDVASFDYFDYNVK